MYSVLIVDDEMIVRHAVKAMIRWDEGEYTLAGTASNGKKALEMVAQHNPDIIITDIKMPEMDGVELIKSLTSNGYQGEILVLSNYQDFSLVREAMKRGIHDYVLKLTVKSEDFAVLLKEMSMKLDRKGKQGLQAVETLRRREDGHLTDWLRQVTMDNAALGESPDSFELPMLNPDERLLAFIVDLHEMHGDDPEQPLQKIVKPIIEEIFSHSLWHHAVQIGSRRCVICVLYNEREGEKRSEQLAERMSSLVSMYFNRRVGIVYTRSASSYNQLAEELRLGVKTTMLSFYPAYRAENISNQMQPLDNEQQIYLAAEGSVKVNLDKLWSNGKDRGLARLYEWLEQTAKSLLSPRIVKKMLIKSVWEMEKTLSLIHANEEDSAADIGWEDAIYSSNTQEECIDMIWQRVELLLKMLDPNEMSRRTEVRQALRYIDQQYRHKITIADIAAHVSLSEAHLCKIFKSDVKKSIISYLNELRLKKAHEMLTSGQVLVKEAASAVGIDDPFYFNRLFKRYYGVSPKDIKPNSFNG